MNIKRPQKLGIWLLFLLLFSLNVFGLGSGKKNNNNLNSDNSKVEFLIFGSLHLRQINQDVTPVSVELIRQSLQKYKPDHIVVEWRHPSIDPAKAFNYRNFEDFKTLSRLWGYKLDKLDESFSSAKDLLKQHKNLDSTSKAVARVRVELGKLYYLKKDRLNAGYQWWLADDLGADVADLKRLTRNNFARGESNVFGFEIARKQGVEYITPFDYQGEEAGSGVWGEMLNSLTALAIKSKHQLEKTDVKWKKVADEFKKERRRFEQNKDKVWVEKYGDIKEIAEYVKTWEGFRWKNAQMPKAKDGLAQMRYLQGSKYEAVER